MSKEINPRARFTRLTQAVEARAAASGAPFVAMTNSYDTFRVLAWVGPDHRFAGLTYEGLRGHQSLIGDPFHKKASQYSVSGSIGVARWPIHNENNAFSSSLSPIEYIDDERKVYPHSSRGHARDIPQLVNRIAQIVESGRPNPNASGVDLYVSPTLG